jgi:hypothetical protein
VACGKPRAKKTRRSSRGSKRFCPKHLKKNRDTRRAIGSHSNDWRAQPKATTIASTDSRDAIPPEASGRALPGVEKPATLRAREETE